MKKGQQGFTLIEIAIVLVIIGLLLGGVLKGQELIDSAKVKNVINDLNGATASFYAYQDRYNTIPGDDPTAAARWAGALADGTSAQNGNGNGLVAGTYNTGGATQESRLFWQHMRLSGFIKGTLASQALAAEQPINKFNGMLGVQNNGIGLAGLILCQSNLPAKAAQAVDTQFDDGIGTTGSMRARLGPGNPSVGGVGTASNPYVDNGSNYYTVCKNL